MIVLHLNPPPHAAVFRVEKNTAIQGLDREDRQLPLAPEEAQCHGFAYKHNGTLSLFSELNIAARAVPGRTAPRHTRAQFLAILTGVVAAQSRKREIHVICANVSNHKTAAANACLPNTQR